MLDPTTSQHEADGDRRCVAGHLPSSIRCKYHQRSRYGLVSELIPLPMAWLSFHVTNPCPRLHESTSPHSRGCLDWTGWSGVLSASMTSHSRSNSLFKQPILCLKNFSLFLHVSS